MKIADLTRRSLWRKNENSLPTPPQITVLLPVYNGLMDDSFCRGMQSILSQRKIAIELIVINDGSTDETQNYIINHMQQDNRVSLITHSEKMDMHPVSLYEGYLKARGDFLIFAEQGFIFADDCFEKIYHAIQDRSCWMVVGVAHKILIDNTVQICGNLELSRLISQNIFESSAVIIQRSVLEIIGLCDPHYLMRDFFAWDLWLRIAAHYPIRQVDVLMGEQKIRQCSIGQDYFQSEYCARIIMNLDRQAILSAKDFSNLDIYRNFPKDIECKLWPYIKDSEKIFVNNISSEKTSLPLKVRRKICILSPKEPSPFYPFFALNETDEFEVIFMDLPSAIRSKDLISADLVIINRYLLFFISVIEKLNSLSIPWGYFIDDNFTFLAQEGYAQFEWYTGDNLKQYLSTANVVFTSTKALMQYYKQYQLHHNVHILQPTISSQLLENSERIRPIQTQSDGVHIAMVGGDFRYDSFVKTVLPALITLSLQTKITLWSTCDIPKENNLPHNIAVYKLTMQPDYEQFILALASLGIDFVVHPYGKTKDIPYKTDAILLVARYLQANIVVGDEPCFNAIIEDDGVFKADNTEQGFYNEFIKLMNKETADRQRDRLIEYCKSHYSVLSNKETLQKILSHLPWASSFVIENRSATLTHLFFNTTLEKTKLIKAVERFQERGIKWMVRALLSQILLKLKDQFSKLRKIFA